MLLEIVEPSLWLTCSPGMYSLSRSAAADWRQRRISQRIAWYTLSHLRQMSVVSKFLDSWPSGLSIVENRLGGDPESSIFSLPTQYSTRYIRNKSILDLEFWYLRSSERLKEVSFEHVCIGQWQLLNSISSTLPRMKTSIDCGARRSLLRARGL